MSQACLGCHKEIYRCCKDDRDLQITYGSIADINYTCHTQTFYGKIKQFDFSVASPQILPIRGGCHNYIMNGMDVFMDEKYDL